MLFLATCRPVQRLTRTIIKMMVSITANEVIITDCMKVLNTPERSSVPPWQPAEAILGCVQKTGQCRIQSLLLHDKLHRIVISDRFMSRLTDKLFPCTQKCLSTFDTGLTLI
jgi:hypothetical protein